MEAKMSKWGVGPIFVLFSIVYLAIMLAISYYYNPLFQIKFIPYGFMMALGIVLIVIGIPFYVLSVKAIVRAFNADELVTDGVYCCCRHPLYASFVVFIVPGIVLLANSWIGLTTPIFMYLILYQLVKKEEVYLESVFGTDYIEYKRQVPCILPYGFLKKKV